MDIITQDSRFRQGVVKYSYKHTVAEAAIRYKVSERTLYRRRDKYNGTLDSLKDRSRRPKRCNNEQTAEEIALIKKLYPYYPDKMTLWDRLRQKGYKRCYKTLCKTIRKPGLETSGGKRKPRKPKPYKRAEYPGQKVQIDVKYVPSACVADCGIIYHRIRVATPRHNGKVERQHRIDEVRFYSRMRLYSLEDGRKQVKT